MRPRRTTIIFLLVACLAGFGCAEVLADGALPLPTVSLPTVTTGATISTPTVTTPVTTVAPPTVTTPTVTAPAVVTLAPPPPHVLVVRVPTPPAAPGSSRAPQPAAPRAGATGRASGSASRASAGSGGGASVSGGTAPQGSAGPSSSSTRRSQARHAAKPGVTTARSHIGRATVIRFSLARPLRVRLVLRGPVPSCRVLGVIRARGKTGRNAIVFAGRLHGRPLRPGVYSLTLVRPARRGANTVLVRVIGPGRTVPLRTVHRRAGDCESTFAPRGDASFVATSALTALTALLGGASVSPPGGSSPSPRTRPSGPPAKAGVLGVKASSLDAQRRFGSAESGALATLPTMAGVALLIAIALAIATTMVLVVRFLRGSWNP